MHHPTKGTPVKKSMIGLALGTTLALAASACSSSAGSSSDEAARGALPAVGKPEAVSQQVYDTLKGKKVAWAAGGAGYPLLDQWTNTFKSAFPALGVDFTMNEAGADPQKLVQNAQTLLNDKPDVLILHNLDLSNASNLIQKAQKDGTYVITVNLPSVAQSDAFVGPDFTAAGTTLAERMVTDCQAKGRTKVAIINGFESDGTTVLAQPAMKKVFDNAGLEVVSTQAGQFDPTKARDITQTVLQQHPDLCGFIGMWDAMMAGSANAVKQAGLAGKVGVYSLDASVSACQGLADGSFTAVLDYGAATMGSQIVALSQYLLESGKAPGASKTVVYTRQQIVDKSNFQTVPTACYDGNS
jgi:ribose transport system substrate-binding protein